MDGAKNAAKESSSLGYAGRYRWGLGACGPEIEARRRPSSVKFVGLGLSARAHWINAKGFSSCAGRSMRSKRPHVQHFSSPVRAWSRRPEHTQPRGS